MSGVSLGKKLLRNVIRHTDIHNKLQEEQDMWKLRGLEKTVLQSDTSSNRPPASPSRGYMHCDRDEDDWSPARNRGGVKGRESEKQERGPRLSERDERDARYWSRKLYEFEANDPDRWGHSGFKELYPEEFKSDSEDESSGDTNARHRKKKCKSSRGEDEHRKHSKKASHKKKKRRRKREKKKKRKADASSSSDSDDTDGETRRKRRKEGKRKVRRKKAERGRREEESSSEESDSEGEGEGEGERRSGGGQRKRHRRDSQGTHQEVSRKKRKNWKAADEEKSDDSSED
ncbi:hypothetical protein ACEWY4_018846 [Coilia grayii]|uniref:NKAP domain containing 1 n=1 Tax=Coilia grayii TaxID=363190 RepID=A0ABD1JEF0_9TELE